MTKKRPDIEKAAMVRKYFKVRAKIIESNDNVKKCVIGEIYEGFSRIYEK